MVQFAKHFDAGQGLFGRVLRGGAWLGMASATEYGFRFFRNVLLARILVPDAFGLMAIVLSVCSLFQVVTGLGIKESVVQSPRGSDQVYLNGAWWLGLGRGLIIYLAAFIAAPWIARFYSAPELASLLRIAFIGVLAQSAISVRAFVAVKEMRYSQWALIQQGASIVAIAITIMLTFWLKSVLALVLGYAVEGLLRCSFSFFVCPFRPTFCFNRDDLRALFKFAGGLFGLPVLMLIYSEGIVFTVGKLCTKEEVGIFALALTLARLPSIFSSQLADLLMPVFSRIQHDPYRIREGILKTTTAALLFGLPAALFIAVYGREVLCVVYGARYADGSNAFFFLFVNELLLVCSVPMASVYIAIGRPSLLRRFSVVRAVIMILLAVPMVRLWGIAGAALVPLVAMSTAYAIQLDRLRDLIELDVRQYIGIWARAVLAAVPWGVLWFLTASLMSGMRPLARLVSALSISFGFLLVSSAAVYRICRLRRYFWPFVAPVA